MVRPHLEYCIVTWSPYYIKDKVLIEKVQRRFTRMIPSVSQLPYEQTLAKLHLWKTDVSELTSSNYIKLFTDCLLLNSTVSLNVAIMTVPEATL